MQAAEMLHTLTPDTFLFLYDVSESEEIYRVAFNYLKMNRCGGERDKDTAG